MLLQWVWIGCVASTASISSPIEIGTSAQDGSHNHYGDDCQQDVSGNDKHKILEGHGQSHTRAVVGSTGSRAIGGAVSPAAVQVRRAPGRGEHVPGSQRGVDPGVARPSRRVVTNHPFVD